MKQLYTWVVIFKHPSGVARGRGGYQAVDGPYSLKVVHAETKDAAVESAMGALQEPLKAELSNVYAYDHSTKGCLFGLRYKPAKSA